jgi:peptidoglycan/LPS O-acetylase OafA/YrhL
VAGSDSQRRLVRPRHRDDIQGLRAVAVLLVALSHAGVGFLKGGFVGVDVFFVLSGFLITQLLLSEAVERRSVSLVNFYVRRARRILPAAALTLVATDIAAYYLLNFVRARQALSDSIWASLFASNIHFANQATDYFAQGEPPSPVLHFWSLSVEEQFYFVWPTLVALALFGTVLGLRLRRGRLEVSEQSLRRLLLVAVLAGVGSLAWSVYATSVTPAAAYFSSLARAWELALGAALAICAPMLPAVGPAIRVAFGWLGVACIGLAAVTFSGSTPFPGYAALLPTLGTALVIAAGIEERQPRRAVGRLLALAPMRYIGDRSYTFYLWHWPVLVLTAEYVGHDLTLATNLLLLLGAFLLSSATFALYENPLRRMTWPRPAGVLLWPASAAAVVIAAWLSIGAIDSKIAHVPVAQAATQPAINVDTHVAGKSVPALPAVIAAVTATTKGAKIPSPLVPPINKLQDDFYDYPDSRCVAHDGQAKSEMICRLTGPAASPSTSPTTTTTTEPTPTKTLVVMGDSHSQMWMPSILSMAQRDGWTVIPLGKSRCNVRRLFASGGPANEKGIRAECRRWYLWALGEARALHPSAILLSLGYSGDTGIAAQQDVNGITSWETTVKRFSKRVLVIADTPYLSQLPQPVDCILARHATMKTCTGAWTEQQLSITRAVAALAPLHGVHLIDTTGWFCFNYKCPLVIGHTIAYKDYGHVSATYAKALAPTFRAAFRRAIGQTTP